MDKVKTLFIGTGEFAVPILGAALAHPNLDVVGVVTQPDRPAGRKQELKPPPVKQYLLDNSIQIAIEQPEKIRVVAQELLDRYQPELILVASYGQIIPNSILDYPKYKALNFHGSLLPKLRGAVPVPMAILQDFKETGVTLQVMSEKMDEGPIISAISYQLSASETSESLMSKLAELAIEILNKDLIRWVNQEIAPIDQNHSEATYCYKDDISKDKAEVKFETDINLAERMVRSFYPWPIAWVKLNNGKILKIYKASVESQESLPTGVDSMNQEPNNVNQESRTQKHESVVIIKRSGSQLFLHLQNGVLELLEIQLEGKNRDNAKNYLYLTN